MKTRAATSVKAKSVRRVASRKRPANVSVDGNLLSRAKELGINLSKTLEDQLTLQIREAQRREWLIENREAIEAYNERIDRDGSFSDRLRRF